MTRSELFELFFGGTIVSYMAYGVLAIPSVYLLRLIKIRRQKKEEQKLEWEEETRRAVTQMLTLLTQVPLNRVVSACQEAGIDWGAESLSKLLPYNPKLVGAVYGSLLLATKEEGEMVMVTATHHLGMTLAREEVGDNWREEFLQGLSNRHPEEGYGDEVRKSLEEQLERVRKCNEGEAIKKGIKALKAV